MACEAYCPLQYIQLTFVLVTIPIYIAVLITLIKFRNSADLQSSFFALCIPVGICDIIFLVNSWFGWRLNTWGWVTGVLLAGGKNLARTMMTVSIGILTVEYLGTVFLAINRLTAVAMPIKHNQIWTSANVAAVISIQWLAGVLSVAPMFTMSFGMQQPSNSSQIVFIAFDEKQNWDSYMIFIILRAMSTAFILICAYTLIVVAILVQRKQNGHIGMSDKVELRLSACGLLICTPPTAATLFLILGLPLHAANEQLFNVLLFGIGDLVASVNPWALLIFCSALRRHLLELVGAPHLLANTVQPITVKQPTNQHRTTNV